jgi:hypothetical protein
LSLTSIKWIPPLVELCPPQKASIASAAIGLIPGLFIELPQRVYHVVEVYRASAARR